MRVTTRVTPRSSQRTVSGLAGSAARKGRSPSRRLLEKNLGKPEAGFINKQNFHLDTTVVIDVNGDTRHRAFTLYVLHDLIR